MKKYIFLLFIICLLIPKIYCQGNFSISLAVQESADYTAYHDEPLVFTTSIYNDGLRQNIQWNIAADEWLTQLSKDYTAGKISLDEFNKETALANSGKRNLNIITIGSVQSPWFKQISFRIFSNGMVPQNAWPINLLGNVASDPVAVLDEKGYYRVKHHLTPQQVSMLAPGTYKIKVFLAQVWSNTVTLEIKKQDMPGGVLKSTDMQLRLGNYYLLRNDADKAIGYAEAILKKDPANIGALILRGESYILKQNYKLALADFEKALKEYFKQFPGVESEPPEYLEDTIEWLKNK
ncbi:MAG: hypothetical protein ABIN01_15535 [Ferruginibacter sp.]